MGWGGVPLAMAPIIANGSLMGENHHPAPLLSLLCTMLSLSPLSLSQMFMHKETLTQQLCRVIYLSILNYPNKSSV